MTGITSPTYQRRHRHGLTALTAFAPVATPEETSAGIVLLIQIELGHLLHLYNGNGATVTGSARWVNTL
jgi:hypothetical protein